MKIFVITTDADITPKDIQDYIWMNIDYDFALTVAEITGTFPTKTYNQTTCRHCEVAEQQGVTHIHTKTDKQTEV